MFQGDWDAENRYQVASALDDMRSLIGWDAFEGVTVRIIYEDAEDRCQYHGLAYNDAIVFYVCKGRVLPLHLIYHEFGHIYRNRYAAECVPPAWQPIEAVVEDDYWGSVPARLHSSSDVSEQFTDAFANYMSENIDDADWLESLFSDNVLVVQGASCSRAPSLPRASTQGRAGAGSSVQPHARLPRVPR